MARAAEKGHSPGEPMGQALWKVSEPWQTTVVTILADQLLATKLWPAPGGTRPKGRAQVTGRET